MTLSRWKRRRSSREIERTRFDNRARVIVSSNDNSLIGKEVIVERDSFINKPGSKKWRYCVPIPNDHPLRKKSPYLSYKMCCGVESREVAMFLADIEASEMGYVVTKPFELINDPE